MSSDLSTALQKLKVKQAIELARDKCPGYYSPLFVVPKRDGGSRPVFNLRRLNNYLIAPHFKMETMTQVLRLVQPGDYMTSLDLSDAFLHVPIHPQSRKYLRFRWHQKTYQFKTAPFGLSLVPWLFTRLTKPILQWALSAEYASSIPGRLDNHSLLLSASDETHCTIENTTHGPRLAHQPEEVDDGANTDHTTPRLHYRFNTDETQDTGSEASRFEEVHSINCRSPSSITENNSQSHHAHTRHRPGSLSDVSLHAETDAVQESARSISEAMGFETTSTTRLSGRVALVASQHHQLERTVLGTTTADIHALCRRQRRRMGSSPRPDDDTTTLVTRVKDALNQLARITSGIPSHPRLPTAPQHVDSDPDRQYLCNDIRQQAGRRSIASAQRPRRSSVASLSSEPCASDGTTYTRDPELGSGSGITLFPDTTIMAAVSRAFQLIQHRFGHHDVDLFADFLTRLLPRYVTWLYDAQAMATDAFTIPWSSFTNPFLHPSWALIPRCLAKISQDRVPQATLVTPHWLSAIWYPQLLAMTRRHPLLMNPRDCIRMLTPGCPSPWDHKNWKLAVWQLSGAALRPAVTANPLFPPSWNR